MKNLRKTSFILALIIVLTMIFASCGRSDAAGEGPGGAAKPEYDGFTGNNSGDVSTDDASNVLDADRKIIKTVNERIETDAYDSFISSLSDAISSVGGYIASKAEHGNSYHNSQSLRSSDYTIRIPAEKLDEFTEKIDSLAVVTSYNESMVDVTEAYVDVESRIAIYESERIALLGMLEEATNVDTLLVIRSRLLSVEADLASLKAQKQSYDSRIAYSTIYLYVNEVRRAVAENPGFFEEVGSNFSDSLYEIGQVIRSFGVWLFGDIIYIILVCAVIAGTVVLLRFLYLKRKKQKTSRNNPTQENLKSDSPDSDNPKENSEKSNI